VSIFEWALDQFPGTVDRFEDRLEISHGMGDTSTFWLNPDPSLIPAELQALKHDIYEQFDGVDLFSSAFKICSLGATRYLGEVPIVGTLEKMKRIARDEGVSYPDFVPFMDGSGQWIYGINSTGLILVWDREYERPTSFTYKDIYEVLAEWKEAIEEHR
jgi:hypothetical protein